MKIDLIVVVLFPVILFNLFVLSPKNPEFSTEMIKQFLIHIEIKVARRLVKLNNIAFVTFVPYTFFYYNQNRKLAILEKSLSEIHVSFILKSTLIK